MTTTSTRSLPKSFTKRLAFTLLMLAGILSANADVSLPRIFANNMVFQQSSEVNLWGWATAGEVVTITADWSEQTETSVTTGSDGKWTATLTTPAAPTQQEGYTLTFSGSTNTLTLNNVLLGEVWLLSGQSNMALPLSGWPNGDPPAIVEGSAEAIANANFPDIRIIVVGENAAETPQDDFTPHWALSSWTECSPSQISNFSALGYFFGKELHEELNIPIGLIHSAWGGSSCEAWLAEDDLQRVANYRGQGPWNLTSGNTPNQIPSLNYNGMIAPLIPFSIAGVLWYQGETNMGRAEELTQLFPEVISSWRNKWGQGDFPFYFAHLAPYDDYWQLQLPDFWEAQSSALNLPNTGLAITIDLGDDHNIHPPKKEPIGHRMALMARSRVYGESDLVTSGPLYRSMKIEDDSIRIYFDHTGTGLVAMEGGLQEFEIAGSDNNFVSATATIDGHTVLVHSDAIDTPTNARYAWTDIPNPSLYNSDNLPAASFRTNPASYIVSHNGHLSRLYNQGGSTFDSANNNFSAYGVTLPLSGDHESLAVIQSISELTHANTLRLTWPVNSPLSLDEQAELIEKAILRCLAFGLIPILSLDIDGDATLDAATTFWTRPQMAALAQRFETNLIVEVSANWQPANAAAWKSECQNALIAFQNAGIQNLIALEAIPNDQAASLINEGQLFVSENPLQNILFSISLTGQWDNDEQFTNALDQLTASQIPIIINGFGDSKYGTSTLSSETIMAACAARSISYLAGTWNGSNPDAIDPLDILDHNSPSTLNPAWGQTVVNGPNGIANLATKSPTPFDAFNYEQWSSRLDWQDADSTKNGDPDSDGLSNNLERILGLNPLAYNQFPTADIGSSDDGFGLSYKLGPGANDLDGLKIESSSDLTNWLSTSLKFDYATAQWELDDSEAPTSLVLRNQTRPDGTRSLSFANPQSQSLFLKLDIQILQDD